MEWWAKCRLSFSYFQYAAVYVKKHLIESLVAKIKVLKLLTHKFKVSKESVVKTIDKLCPGAVTKAMLEHIGLTRDQYKNINPNAAMFKLNSETTNSKPINPGTLPMSGLHNVNKQLIH